MTVVRFWTGEAATRLAVVERSASKERRGTMFETVANERMMGINGRRIRNGLASLSYTYPKAVYTARTIARLLVSLTVTPPFDVVSQYPKTIGQTELSR